MNLFYSETEIVARVEGLTVARLRAFVAAECVAPAEREGRLVFREVDLARVRLLAELVRDFDLDPDAAGMVVSLVDQFTGSGARCASSARRSRPSQAMSATGSASDWRRIGWAPGAPEHYRRISAMGRLLSALVVALTAAAMVVMAQDHAMHEGGEGPATAGYAAANAAMHEAMAIEYSGDPHDFARAMIPHHQGAIDMAEVSLANGNDPDLRKLAEEIIAAQQSEIAFLKHWLAAHGGSQ